MSFRKPRYGGLCSCTNNWSSKTSRTFQLLIRRANRGWKSGHTEEPHACSFPAHPAWGTRQGSILPSTMACRLGVGHEGKTVVWLTVNSQGQGFGLPIPDSPMAKFCRGGLWKLGWTLAIQQSIVIVIIKLRSNVVKWSTDILQTISVCHSVQCFLSEGNTTLIEWNVGVPA